MANTFSAPAAVPAPVPVTTGTQPFVAADPSASGVADSIHHFRAVLKSVSDITPDFAAAPAPHLPGRAIAAFNARTAFEKVTDLPVVSAQDATDIYTAMLLQDAPAEPAVISPTLLALLGETAEAETDLPKPAPGADLVTETGVPLQALPLTVAAAPPPAAPARAPETPVARAASPAGPSTRAEKTDRAAAEISTDKTPPDATASPVSQPAPHSAAQQATQAPAARPHAVPLANVPDIIAVEARKLVAGDVHEFIIRLDPANLGRIDVRLEVKSDGYVTAIVRAEKASTQDMMQQDARGFEQTLNDSGLRTTAQSISFTSERDTASAFADMMPGNAFGNPSSARHTPARDAMSASNADDASQIHVSPARRLSLSSIDVMA